MNPLLRRTLGGTVLLLSPLAGCQDSQGQPHAEEAVHRADRPAFHAAPAFALLEDQVAFGPRVPGTPGHAAQLAWMHEYLAARADTVILQRFEHTTRAGETLRLANVFARFRVTERQRVLLLAHWDTRPAADEDPDPANRGLPVPGANDGASGVAVLLHLAQLFAERPPPIGVDLLFTDGEDYGPGSEDMYLGARHFAATMAPVYAPLYGVLLDMVGTPNPRFTIEGHSHRFAPEVARRVWDVARQLGHGEHFPITVGPPVDDDHLPLNRAGIRTINVIDFSYPYWHTVRDVPANTSAETLRMVGEVVAELIYRGG
jgi:glutaminyl-peptide cyclotransferase